MTSILPAIKDRYRNKRDGSRRYVGQVLCFSGGERSVIAEVYGTTLDEMRTRKHAVAKVLKELEEAKK